MSALTRVELLFWPGRLNDRLRFGAPVAERRLDRRRAQTFFAPGQRFAFVRWRAGDCGTEVWRLWVLRAVAPDEAAATIAGVAPGAAILVAAAGDGPVKRALALIDAIEAAGADPAQAPEAYWRMAANRLAVRRPLRVYGAAEQGWAVRLEPLS
ncbi:MAG: DUF2840 domain-containing protein [Phenylobacterium sp.]|uniref:DUF2840 domain-containing protein n=1 Tax=Phenylobacterium sp. TaxID=1871053 RepID=UPI002734C9BD|nr:DUF2840 domain-containing protein [Phenylobacterium sp.]MDP3746655.1 DUF2840 domain-containing protein [Phenylobacterium sp.]